MHQRSGNPDTMAARRNKHRASRVAGPNPCALVRHTEKASNTRLRVGRCDRTPVGPIWSECNSSGQQDKVLNLLWPDCMAEPRCEGD